MSLKRSSRTSPTKKFALSTESNKIRRPKKISNGNSRGTNSRRTEVHLSGSTQRELKKLHESDESDGSSDDEDYDSLIKQTEQASRSPNRVNNYNQSDQQIFVGDQELTAGPILGSKKNSNIQSDFPREYGEKEFISLSSDFGSFRPFDEPSSKIGNNDTKNLYNALETIILTNSIQNKSALNSLFGTHREYVKHLYKNHAVQVTAYLGIVIASLNKLSKRVDAIEQQISQISSTSRQSQSTLTFSSSPDITKILEKLEGLESKIDSVPKQLKQPVTINGLDEVLQKLKKLESKIDSVGSVQANSKSLRDERLLLLESDVSHLAKSTKIPSWASNIVNSISKLREELKNTTSNSKQSLKNQVLLNNKIKVLPDTITKILEPDIVYPKTRINTNKGDQTPSTPSISNISLPKKPILNCFPVVTQRSTDSSSPADTRKISKSPTAPMHSLPSLLKINHLPKIKGQDTNNGETLNHTLSTITGNTPDRTQKSMRSKYQKKQIFSLPTLNTEKLTSSDEK